MSGERGEIGLAQMLVALAMMLGVLGATLTVFASAERVNRDANIRNDFQDQARRALDELTTEVRNLASPTPDEPQAIDFATPFDLVFRTVDRNGPNPGLNAANVMRVRYCLGGTSAAGDLYRQEQRWTTTTTPSSPSTAACPSADVGWAQTRVVAQSITNRRDGLERSLFSYNAASPVDVSSIHAQLYVGGDPTTGPPETSISSGVFLRNQNRRPIASFSADATTVRGHVILNGAASYDPEGDPLKYVWFDGASKIGDGIRYDYTVSPGSSHTIQLKVFDLAGLDGVSSPLTVVAQP